MTNYQKIASVIVPFIGKVLTAQQIQLLVLEKYPDTNRTSIMPADMARDDMRYADKVLHPVGRSLYRVLTLAERKGKPQSARSGRGVSDALAQAQIAALRAEIAKLQGQASKPTDVPAPTPAVNPVVTSQATGQATGKPNGQASK